MSIEALIYESVQLRHRMAVANGKIKYIKDEVHKADKDVAVNILYRDDEESLMVHFIRGEQLVRTLVGVEDANWKMDILVKQLLKALEQE